MSHHNHTNELELYILFFVTNFNSIQRYTNESFSISANTGLHLLVKQHQL